MQDQQEKGCQETSLSMHAWCGVNYMHILLKRSIICVTGTCHAAVVNYLGEACSGRLPRKHATYPYTNYMATTVSIIACRGVSSTRSSESQCWRVPPRLYKQRMRHRERTQKKRHTPEKHSAEAIHHRSHQELVVVVGVHLHL